MLFFKEKKKKRRYMKTAVKEKKEINIKSIAPSVELKGDSAKSFFSYVKECKITTKQEEHLSKISSKFFRLVVK
jgi:hypothetical protein